MFQREKKKERKKKNKRAKREKKRERKQERERERERTERSFQKLKLLKSIILALGIRNTSSMPFILVTDKKYVFALKHLYTALISYY